MMETPSSSATSRDQLAASIPEDVRNDVMSLITVNRNRTDVILDFINSTISKSMSPSDMHRFKALCFALYDSSVPLPLARSVFRQLVSSMMTLDDDLFMDVATFFMTVHQVPNNNSRSFALEFTLVSIRQRMSVIHEQRGEYFKAADVLTRIPIETIAEMDNGSISINAGSNSSSTGGGGNISVSETGGFAINVRIAHLFIAAGLVDRAESYLSRATTHRNTFKGNDSVRLQYRICHARILDLKRRFEDAAHKYYVLASDSQSAAHLVDAMTDTQVPALVHAVTCAILAPAGPRRSRLLAMLYNDERSQRLDIYRLLESIHMGRLLQKDQVDRLRPTLQPHQLTPHPDGDTVLDHAVIEHNMLAISRMYINIGLDQLGALLNVTPEKAEKTARIMINEKRMKASIDQVDHIVQFSNQSPTAKIEHWDTLIASICGQVDDCVDAIVQKYPSLAATNI